MIPRRSSIEVDNYRRKSLNRHTIGQKFHVMQNLNPEVIKSLSQQSDKELVNILWNPDDWKPEVLEFVRTELARRSVSVEKVESKISEQAKIDAEELHKRAQVPLTTSETVWTIIYGFIGPMGPGLIIQFFTASSFKKNGYFLKSKKSWRLFWLVFAIVFVLTVVLRTISTELSFRGANGK